MMPTTRAATMMPAMAPVEILPVDIEGDSSGWALTPTKPAFV